MENDQIPVKINTELKANLGDVTALGGKIIETIQSACGMMYRPIGTVLQAHADAAARKIAAKGELDVSQLLRDAGERFYAQQVRQQANIDAVVAKALNQPSPEKVSGEACDPDWINEFIDSVKNISNEQMQELLARLLSGEVTQPGTISRRTINTVRTISRQELETFQELLRFGWELEDRRIVIPRDVKYRPPDAEEPPYVCILQCQSIGLLHDLSSFQLPEKSVLRNGGRRHVVAEGKTLQFEVSSLTPTGNELAAALNRPASAGAYLYWISRWKSVLEPHADFPPSFASVSAKEFPKKTDEELSVFLDDAVKRLHYWVDQISPAAEPDQSYVGPFFANRLKHAVEVYHNLRNEFIRRDPLAAERLPEFDGTKRQAE